MSISLHNMKNNSKILIHTCCADCLLKTVDSLNKKTFSSLVLTLSKSKKWKEGLISHLSFYFYNPNIHPRTEYLARLSALKEVIKSKYGSSCKLIVPDMRVKEYFEKMPTNNKFPSQSVRCPICWKLRLEKTFEYAKEHNYDTVTTTLLSSNYQDVDTIIRIGNALAQQFGIKFLVPENIDKEMCNHGFYKQNYCGCCYSLVEKYTNLENS